MHVAVTLMSSIHRATLRTLAESIPEIDDACVGNQRLHKAQMLCKVSATACCELIHVRERLISRGQQVVEHQCQLAMRQPRVEILTEVGARSTRQLLELNQSGKVGRLTEQNPERDSSVLSAGVACVSQRRALRATNERGNIRCLRSNVASVKRQSSIVDASHSCSQISQAASTSEDRQMDHTTLLTRRHPMCGLIDRNEREESLCLVRSPFGVSILVICLVSTFDVDPLCARVSRWTAGRAAPMRIRCSDTAGDQRLHRAQSMLQTLSVLELNMHSLVCDESAEHRACVCELRLPCRDDGLDGPRIRISVDGLRMLSMIDARLAEQRWLKHETMRQKAASIGQT